LIYNNLNQFGDLNYIKRFLFFVLFFLFLFLFFYFFLKIIYNYINNIIFLFFIFEDN